MSPENPENLARPNLWTEIEDDEERAVAEVRELERGRTTEEESDEKRRAGERIGVE